MHIGGDEEDRTLDLTDANRTLSQLSYAPKNYFIIIASLFRNFQSFFQFFLKYLFSALRTIKVDEFCFFWYNKNLTR